MRLWREKAMSILKGRNIAGEIPVAFCNASNFAKIAQQRQTRRTTGFGQFERDVFRDVAFCWGVTQQLTSTGHLRDGGRIRRGGLCIHVCVSWDMHVVAVMSTRPMFWNRILILGRSGGRCLGWAAYKEITVLKNWPEYLRKFLLRSRKLEHQNVLQNLLQVTFEEVIVLL